MALIIAHLRDEEKCRHGGDAVSNYIMLAAHQAQMAVSCFGERGAGIFRQFMCERRLCRVLYEGGREKSCTYTLLAKFNTVRLLL